MIKPFLPGDRVLVFDPLLYKNDRDTPASITVKPATVVRRVGRLKTKIGSLWLGPYPDCCDVIFDHRPDRVSKGHFTRFIEPLS